MPPEGVRTFLKTSFLAQRLPVPDPTNFRHVCGAHKPEPGFD